LFAIALLLSGLRFDLSFLTFRLVGEVGSRRSWLADGTIPVEGTNPTWDWSILPDFGTVEEICAARDG
jgi:hypothetical protein